MKKVHSTLQTCSILKERRKKSLYVGSQDIRVGSQFLENERKNMSDPEENEYMCYHEHILNMNDDLKHEDGINFLKQRLRLKRYDILFRSAT